MLAVLEAAGATYINFNPITASTITKALQDIAAKEGFALDPDTADAIAQAAAGDLRNAIQSLQLLLLQQQHQAPLQAGKRGKVSSCWQCRRWQSCCNT
jgi:DNA polymerase III delta prime subunit